MISSESPFGHMTSYYAKQGGSPTKTSLANPKIYKEPSREYNQITGVESSNNPFVSTINTKYD